MFKEEVRLCSRVCLGNKFKLCLRNRLGYV